MKSELKRLFPRAAMTLLVMLLTTVSAWADSSGSCGTNVTYTYSESTHTLTISGNGAMADYANADAQPWKDYRSNITSVVIESGVTLIAKNAFNKCSNLATVTFATGSQLTTIGNEAFYDCSALAAITIPSSVTTIGNNAFNRCSALTAFTIPSSVTSIGDGAFSNCSSLATINVEADNIYYSSEGGVLFNYDKTTLLLYPRGNTATSYTIPASVETIDNNAFKENGKLATVTIPNSVQTIGSNAFSGCTNLATVAFAPCSQLVKIGESAFYKCQALTSIIIPASVDEIGSNAFSYITSNRSNLTSVTIYRPNVTSFGSHVFDNNKDGRKIYVFSNCVDFFKSINQLSAYASAIEAIPDLTVKAADDSDASKGRWCTYYNGLSDVKVADGTTIYKAAYDKSANKVTLTLIEGDIIKMGEAVLLKSDANIVLLGTMGTSHRDNTGNDLKGVDYATPLADLGSSTDTYYVLSNKNGHFGFHKYTGTNMPANKAFLRISGDGNALAPSIDLYIDNNATNIQTTDFTDYTDSDAWYTLSGTRLSGKPTQKGLYIHGGKKVVVGR